MSSLYCVAAMKQFVSYKFEEPCSVYSPLSLSLVLSSLPVDFIRFVRDSKKMKSTTALAALLVLAAVLCAFKEVQSDELIEDMVMIEGLQADDAEEFETDEECNAYCKSLNKPDKPPKCVGWSRNQNPNINQCRVFKCINAVQNNVDWNSQYIIPKVAC